LQHPLVLAQLGQRLGSERDRRVGVAVAISRDPAISTATLSPCRAKTATTAGSRKNGCFSEPMTPRTVVSGAGLPASTRSLTEATIAVATPMESNAASPRLTARLTGASTRWRVW
jgi:hypothetical protein